MFFSKIAPEKKKAKALRKKINSFYLTPTKNRPDNWGKQVNELKANLKDVKANIASLEKQDKEYSVEETRKVKALNTKAASLKQEQKTLGDGVSYEKQKKISVQDNIGRAISELKNLPNRTANQDKQLEKLTQLSVDLANKDSQTKKNKAWVSYKNTSSRMLSAKTAEEFYKAEESLITQSERFPQSAQLDFNSTQLLLDTKRRNFNGERVAQEWMNDTKAMEGSFFLNGGLDRNYYLEQTKDMSAATKAQFDKVLNAVEARMTARTSIQSSNSLANAKAFASKFPTLPASKEDVKIAHALRIAAETEFRSKTKAQQAELNAQFDASMKVADEEVFSYVEDTFIKPLEGDSTQMLDEEFSRLEADWGRIRAYVPKNVRDSTQQLFSSSRKMRATSGSIQAQRIADEVFKVNFSERFQQNELDFNLVGNIMRL